MDFLPTLTPNTQGGIRLVPRLIDPGLALNMSFGQFYGFFTDFDLHLTIVRCQYNQNPILVRS
jgi:hypothetical protein